MITLLVNNANDNKEVQLKVDEDVEEEIYEGGVGSRDDENDDPENAIEKGEVEQVDKTVPGEAVVYDNTGRRS